MGWDGLLACRRPAAIHPCLSLLAHRLMAGHRSLDPSRVHTASASWGNPTPVRPPLDVVLGCTDLSLPTAESTATSPRSFTLPVHLQGGFGDPAQQCNEIPTCSDHLTPADPDTEGHCIHAAGATHQNLAGCSSRSRPVGTPSPQLACRYGPHELFQRGVPSTRERIDSNPATPRSRGAVDARHGSIRACVHNAFAAPNACYHFAPEADLRDEAHQRFSYALERDDPAVVRSLIGGSPMACSSPRDRVRLAEALAAEPELLRNPYTRWRGKCVIQGATSSSESPG